MTIFNVFTLMGGIAMFLYGMDLMGKALEQTAGSKLQGILSTMTSSAMADSLQLLVWSKTKDAQHGRNRPAPVLDTLLGTARRRKVTGFATAAEFEAAKAEILKGG